MVAAQAHADDVVDLHFAAGAHAGPAADAGVEIDRDGGIGDVEPGVGLFVIELRRIAVASRNPHRRRPPPEHRLAIGALFRRPHVAGQKLEDHLARFHRPIGAGADLHAFGRLADARGRQDALAFDLDHAGAAIAVGPIAGKIDVAQVRDHGPFALGHGPDRLAFSGGDGLAIEDELDPAGHFRCPRGNGSAGG